LPIKKRVTTQPVSKTPHPQAFSIYGEVGKPFSSPLHKWRRAGGEVFLILAE